MPLERLYAGWRSSWVQNSPKDGDSSACVMCDIFSSDLDDENLVVYRSKNSMVILNLFPYGSGHVLVVPKDHVPNLSDLDRETKNEMFALLEDIVDAINDVYSPSGINVGANFGRDAGAGIPDHLHFHALPRFQGDSGFITAIAETRVLPEPLEETLMRLRSGFKPNSLLAAK